IGRMILAARDEASLREVLVIAAALSVQDPRDRPLARQGAADAAHARFDDEKSDFLAYLKLWGFFQDALRAKTSKRRLAQLCRDSFLSVARMREWVDIHRQLHTLAAEAGWHEAVHPADYGQIHRALLAGLLGNVGCKSEDSEHYLGARGIKFLVHPGSGVGRKAGRWLMAAEIAQTTRLYARCVARIEPEWLERVGAHLVRRHAYDPHWEKKPAQVIAFERGTLYGLLLYANRRVPFRPPDAAESRRIFIQQALVGGDYETRAPFFQHNRKLIREIEQLEHKSRRPDVLVDDELIYAFYEQRVPAGIDNGAAFDAWRRQAEQGDPELLFLRRTELMRHEAAGITSAQFPPKLELDGHSYALDYRHEPGSARDGATLTVPLAALNQVSATACEWLVPGLLREKVRMLVKSLPQGLRRKLGPAPDFAARFSAAPAQTQVTVAEAIVRHARQELNLQIPLDAFRPETLPAHLAMNFRVVDEHGRELASGRDLAQLRVQLGVKAGERFSALARDEEAARRLTDWSFGDLDGPQEIRRGSETMVGFPALADHGDHVTLDLVDQPDEARRVHRLGLRRLFMLRLKEQARYLEKNLPGLRELALQFALIGDAASLAPQLLAAAFERTCMAEPWPATRAEFDARCDQARSRVVLIGQELARLVAAILAEHQAVLKRLAQSKAFADACRDVEQQLGHLLGPRFVEDTPFERLQHFPRYLKAAGLRLDKLRADAARDRRLAQELAPLQQGWLRERARRERRGVPDAQLDQFRWLLEELRVQLFAQELKTAVPVSVKRLTRFWQSLAP
ncbi:MAG TPA: ATP-dependent RNA helicase HrpA, partial [Burkholderiales bacterium]|nr:ATP-dependent RNA helicase HrpA [Burkholderiales bacterium]